MRPASARDAGDRLKLHRRVLRLDGRDHTVITPRPGTRARYSTNYFHQTWHVLSDQHGAAVLARLLWGLSYQRRPGTVVLIDRPFLDPNPFDATPADPIALVNIHLTGLTNAVARNLRGPTTPSAGTVRWHTPGLDPAVAAGRARAHAIARRESDWSRDPRPCPGGQVRRIGGVLALVAPPEQLRHWAVRVARLGDWWHDGMDYTELECTGGPPGEVQIFRDYRRRVGVAEVARREVLAGAGRLSPADVEPLIWDHLATVRARTT
ncbi:MAG TPA: hypothetical protein VFW65_03585 [Pseudonocardiaceae bacterium]|nr:hypothetical protein [Pseudonocardiaceae bacterium]